MGRKGKKWSAWVVFAFGLVLCLGTDAGAQGGACREDVAKFCKDVQPGGGRLVKCMKEHEKELSAACQQQVHELQRRWREAAQACHDDVLRFCKDVKPGGGRLANCLKEHSNEISAECRERLAQPRKSQ